ncbi:MAG: penicillin-binding protein 2, partial [Planctomicrobium sp.]|nr:penicillin-binding protein 2 [Planctomicrobium sp.]
MTSEAPLVKNRRSQFVQLCVLVIWSVLAARLLHVQYFSQEVFASRALRQQVSHETISARPGDILDRKGRLLATTISVPSLYVNPSRISEPSQVAAKLSEVFELDEQKFISKIEKNRKRQFLWIKRHLTPEQGEMILKLGLPKDQVHLRQEFKRFYPQDSLAAHVIGLRDIDGIGRGGAEQSFNKYLTGTDGKRQFVRDARGNVLEILEEVTQPPENGKTVALTIDTVLQL